MATNLPKFIIIGAAKSGTSSLFEYLCHHPQVYMSNSKEPDFFAIDEIYNRGIEWYSSLFKDARPDQTCGEASTTYTRLPKYSNVAQRLARHLPQVKLIYIMRHPVERAYSHHLHEIKCKEQKPRKTFEEAIKQRSYLVESGDYMKHIETYLEFFPRKSFLCLLMDDFIQKPAEVLSQICRFIEVDSEIDLVQGQVIVANSAQKDHNWFIRAKMTEPFKAIPGVPTLVTWLPQEVRDVAYELTKKIPFYQSWGERQSYLPPPMLPETRQKLLERYRQPNQKLAQFLNRDLSHWNQ
jgi:hypothetical protein